eukprot:scaffold260589_cov36-Tisochrysis_lutea.AAC.1
MHALALGHAHDWSLLLANSVESVRRAHQRRRGITHIWVWGHTAICWHVYIANGRVLRNDGDWDRVRPGRGGGGDAEGVGGLALLADRNHASDRARAWRRLQVGGQALAAGVFCEVMEECSRVCHVGHRSAISDPAALSPARVPRRWVERQRVRR